MKHLFIPYELAVIAKEKGFNEPCIYYFITKNFPEPIGVNGRVSLIATNNNTFDKMICSAPLYQQIVDWFREKHKIGVELQLYAGEYTIYFNKVTKNTNKTQLGQNFKRNFIDGFFDYYQALNKAIEEAFKLI